MRFLKTQTLNRRVIHDNRVELTIGNSFTVAASNNMVLPVSSNDLTAVQTEGMLRYNPTSHEVEVYSGSPAVWRQLRYKEPGKITQQNLGAGDSSTVYFGPLSPSPVSYYSTQSNMTWDVTQMANNVLVIVENVIQLSGTNYTIVQNPTIDSESYTGTTSETESSGNTLYFNSSINASGASGNGTTVTLTFPTQTVPPFAVGANIVVTGFTPSGYNGNFVVTASTVSSVSYANTTTASMSFAGNITASNAIYPAVNIVNAVVTGSPSIPNGAYVVSYQTDPQTDALVSVTLNTPLTGTVAVNSSITIAESIQTPSGYYLFFSSPPPYGKTVTALIGFDQ